MLLPPRARLAAVLWIVFAVVAWNVVFDRVIINAGREYAKAAQQADLASQNVLLIDDWMRPATTRAFRWATAIGGAIGLVGFSALAWAVREEGKEVGKVEGARAGGEGHRAGS